MNSSIIHHHILCQHLQTWSSTVSVLPLHFGTFSLQQWNCTAHHLTIKMFFASSQEANCGRRAASLSRWQRRRREAPWHQIFLECVTVSGRPRGRTLGLHRKHMWVEHRVRESRYKGATEPRHLHTRCSTVTCNRVVNYRRKSQQSTVQPLPHHGYQRQHSSSHHPLGLRSGWWVPFNLFTFVFIFFWLHGIGMVSVGRFRSLQHFHLSLINVSRNTFLWSFACTCLPCALWLCSFVHADFSPCTAAAPAPSTPLKPRPDQEETTHGGTNLSRSVYLGENFYYC